MRVQGIDSGLDRRQLQSFGSPINSSFTVLTDISRLLNVSPTLRNLCLRRKVGIGPDNLAGILNITSGRFASEFKATPHVEGPFASSKKAIVSVMIESVFEYSQPRGIGITIITTLTFDLLGDCGHAATLPP